MTKHITRVWKNIYKSIQYGNGNGNNTQKNVNKEENCRKINKVLTPFNGAGSKKKTKCVHSKKCYGKKRDKSD